MPEGSYNLSASMCQTGQKLAKVPDTPCYKCYADDRGRYRFPNVKAALARRLKSLNHPRWTEAMTVLVKGKKHFRWHDSGDIQSVVTISRKFSKYATTLQAPCTGCQLRSVSTCRWAHTQTT